MFTKANVEAYFTAEKQESLLLLGLGLAAILAAGLCWLVVKSPLAKGVSIPLLAIGLLQCVVGYTVYSRSDAQRKDIVYKMDMNPSAIHHEEIPRMETVMKNFVIYRWVEWGLLMVALAMIAFSRGHEGRRMLLGAGIGLAIQCILLLAADHFAERRGEKYLKGLWEWLPAS